MAIKVEDTTPHDAWTDDVDLVGVEYPFTYPPIGRLIKAQRRVRYESDPSRREEIMTEATFAWLADGFGPEAWAHIEARLDDDDDPLNELHLAHAVRLIKEADAARPTMSSADASQPQQTRKFQAAQSTKESDSPTSASPSYATSSSSGS